MKKDNKILKDRRYVRVECVIMTVSLLENLTHVLAVLYVGGKSSGIFGDPEPPAQPQRPIPPGGSTSNIFGTAEIAPVQSPNRSHPNKPKVGHASNFF